MADQPVLTRAPKITPLEKRLMLDASLPAIAGQVLWLDADDASTIIDADGDNASTGTGGANDGFSGTATTWRDKSGSNFHVTNNTAGQQPTYNATSLNGNGILTFDGVNDKLRNTGASIAGDDVTMFIVFNRTTAAGRDAVFELGSGTSRNALFVNNVGNRLGYYVNSTFYDSSTAYTTGTYEVVSMMQNVNAINLWRNGANEINTTGQTRAATTGIHVGDDSSGSDDLQGSIAEIIVYDRDLSSEERRDVENYLATKWGLTLASNSAPVLSVNTGATVSQSDSVTITSAMISATDADNTDSNLVYTITDVADYGSLTNSNTAQTYGLGDTFLQSDIDNGYILYTHNGTANFSDGFSFTVTDQYTPTAAATFSLTVTPDNIAPQFQGWSLVSSEDFQSGATGWSDNTTETSNPYLTRFLGRQSQNGGAQDVFKTYTLSGSQDYTVISFDMYKLDSWDGESFRVFINDTLIVNLPMVLSTFHTFSDATVGSVSYTVQELTPFGANFVYGQWNDQILRFTLTIQNSAAANVKLGFSSTLDQAISDESWGVDNVNIYEVSEGGTAGPIAVSERTANGSVIGQITATDADAAQSITYSIVGGTGSSVFAINSTTGVISVSNASAIDYEVTPSYTLNIRATDNGTPSLFADTTITVNVINIPENSAPVIGAIGTLTVAENAAVNTVIGTMSATDAESHTITWSITGGNTDNIFAINATTGAIRLSNISNLNYEWDNSYTLTIQAQDNGFGNLTATRNVTVNITNINEAPTFNIPQSFLNQNPYLRYNATTGNFYQYVGTTANYATASAAAAAAMLNGVAGHLATITSAAENTYVRSLGTGNLWLGGSDSVTEGTWIWAGTGTEGGQIFSLGSVAQGGYYTNWNSGEPNSTTDDHLEMQGSGGWNDTTATVAKAYVIEWEGSAVLAALGNGPFSLAENPALNQSVGFAHARDADAGDVIAYSVTGGTGAAHFAINSSTGEITVTNPSAINYESATSFTLDLRVQDAGGLFSTQTVTINITDVNETPILNPGGPYTVAENTANNTLIGTMTASDPDGTALTWSITSGNTLGIFSINNSGQIRIANNTYLDYELATSYTLDIRVSDGTLTDTETITINLSDVAEAPSFDDVQRVLNGDPTLRYSAATGNFYRFVTTNANYAGATAAATAAILHGEAGYLVNVGSLAENNFLRTIISNTVWINGTDAAIEGEWRYSTGPNAGDLFWLGSGTGSAQNGYYANWSSGEPNNSGSNEDAIEFRTNGLWNDSNAAGTRFYVIEWDGAAVLSAVENGPYAMNENSALNTVLGSAAANDVDDGNTLSYSITGGTGAGLFTINSSTGQIRLSSAVNYEATSSYTLDLRVDDGTGLFDTLSITVDINDINDIPSLISLSGNSVVENTAIGTVVGLLSTADEDPADTHIYSIVSNPGGKFIIVGNELRTAGTIDYEANQSFNLSIQTVDGNGGTILRSFMIGVGDVLDTFTPPPPANDAQGSDPYIPPEEEGSDRALNLLGSSLNGEQAQGRSFYNSAGWQVLRENITFQIREFLSAVRLQNVLPSGEASPLVPDSAEDITNTETDLSQRYTNLREAMAFLEQLENTDEEKDSSHAERAERLPESAIERQFVDVMMYHQERAARLRDALMSA